MFYRSCDNFRNISDGNFAKILACGNDMMLVEFKLTKEARTPKHSHEHRQLSYIYFGKVEFIIDGKKSILHAGDSAIIPSNTEHSVIALEDSTLIDVFAPLRNDFLKKLLIPEKIINY